MGRLEGKVVIVTGASRGIGRSLALALAAEGASVVLAARTVEPRRVLPGTIGDTLAQIEAAGGRAIAVQVDVTEVADLERLVTTAVDTYGGLDVLVNNAADTAGSTEPIESHPRDRWLRQFDTNLHAPFTLIGLAVPHLRSRGGGIVVNITSGDGDLRPVAPPSTAGALKQGTILGYATSKAALNRMANALAPDLLADRIAVVNVEPGFTRTELVDILGERGLVDADQAAPMDVPVRTILEVICDPDPMRLTGQIVRAQPDQVL